MKYDSSIVGERVINAAGKEGTIVSVSRNGAVKVKFVGDSFGGEFMFDPFLSGHIKFANQELQKTIDDEIAKEYQQTLDVVNASIAKKKDKQTFYLYNRFMKQCKGDLNIYEDVLETDKRGGAV